MTGVFSHSSTRIGRGATSYSILKCRTLRRRWILACSDETAIHFAAYFVSEDEARRFADTFGLTITEHP